MKSRMHYSVTDGGGPANAVHAHAAAQVIARSYDRVMLDGVLERLMKVFEGAALMTETTCSVERGLDLDNSIPVPELNALLMQNAALVNARSWRRRGKKQAPRILGTSAMFCPAHASALQAMAISRSPATAGKLPNRARAKKTMLRFSMPQKSLRQLHSIVSAPPKRSPQSARRFAGKSSAKL